MNWHVAKTLGSSVVTFFSCLPVSHGSRVVMSSLPSCSQTMRGRVINEMYVDLPAQDVWAVYSSPQLPWLIPDIQPGYFKKIDIIGDGRVGTVLDIELVEGQPEPRTWKEKFMKIDNREREKVVLQIEGGYLDLGFTFYEEIYTIIEKGHDSCIIRSTTIYELDRKFESNASLITASNLWDMAKGIANYAMQKKENGI